MVVFVNVTVSVDISDRLFSASDVAAGSGCEVAGG